MSACRPKVLRVAVAFSCGKSRHHHLLPLQLIFYTFGQKRPFVHIHEAKGATEAQCVTLPRDKRIADCGASADQLRR